MTELETIVELYCLMTQVAKSQLGTYPAPDERTVRNALKDYFRAKNVKPIKFNSMSEMMSFISDIVNKEIFSHR